ARRSSDLRRSSSDTSIPDSFEISILMTAFPSARWIGDGVRTWSSTLHPLVRGSALRPVARSVLGVSCRLIAAVRVDDVGDELVAHDVAAVEASDVDVVDAFEDLTGGRETR